MQELRIGQGAGVPRVQGLFFGGISGFCWTGGGASKAKSSLPVVFCLGLLFLRAAGLDVDSGDCVLFGGDVVCVCVCTVHELVSLHVRVLSF